VHELLKPALVREHGYMFIVSVDGSTAKELGVAL